MIVSRGEIYLVALDPVKGSEQGKTRPCLIVQTNMANKFSNVTIIVPITSAIPDKNYPHVVVIQPYDSGLKESSAVLCNQIRAVSVPERIIKKIGALKPELMEKVDASLKVILGLDE